VVVGLGVDNLIQVFMQALMHEGGPTKVWLVRSWWHLMQMGFLFFHALSQMLFDKFLMVGLHIPWGFTTWFKNQFGDWDSVTFANGEHNWGIILNLV
jgi:hypothetical protein